MFENFGNWLGQGQNRDLFSVLAGGAGAAIAGPDTWQGRLGNFAGSMGQSGIADAAGQDQRGKLMELLVGALGGQPGQPGGGMPVTNVEQALRPASALEGRSKLDELFPALGGAGVQMPTQQLGSPGAAPAPTQAAPAAPGGGQSSDPFWRRFF